MRYLNETVAIDAACRYALSHYADSDEMYTALAKIGANDDEVWEVVCYVMRSGGASFGGYDPWIHGETHEPGRIWVSRNGEGYKPDRRPDFSGKTELVALARRLFGIGPKGQMKLF